MKDQLQSLFNSILDQKSQLGIDHLFLSALVTTQRGASVFEQKLDSVEIADEIKIGVRVAVGNQWGCSSLEKADEKSLLSAIASARDAAHYGDADSCFDLSPAVTHHTSFPDISSIQKLSIKNLEKYALHMEEVARKSSPLIVNIPASWSGFEQTARILAHSEGLRVVEESGLFKIALSVMARGPDGRIVNVSENKNYGYLSQLDPSHFATQVAEEVVQRVGSQTPLTGQTPVIFDAHTASQILSSFVPVFTGDFLYRKLSWFEGKQGTLVASPLISIVDEGFAGLMPHHYDAEGSPCPRKFIVNEGIFDAFLHNRYTANKLKVSTTGNAVGGLGGNPGVGPANLSWEGKSMSEVDLMKAMNTGLYLKELHGASASPISGDFSYGALGYWVENGQIAYPVADFTVAGNFFSLLQNIRGLSNCVEYFSPHTLGSTGGGSLLVEGLMVSGKKS